MGTRCGLRSAHRYIKENAGKVLPREVAELCVETLNTLVLDRQLQGFKNKDDESMLQDALRFQRALTGENSVETAQQHERLADLFREQGRYKEAEGEYRQSLELRKGQVIPATIDLQAKLAYDLAAEGQYASAESQAIQALRAAKSEANSDSVMLSAYNHLAELYRFEHKTSEEEATLKAALSQQRASDSKSEPQRIELENRLISVYIDQGRFHEAAQKLEAMRSVVEKKGPSEDGVVVEENLAVVSVKLKECTKASISLQRALSEAGNLKTNRIVFVDDVLEKKIPRDVECSDLGAAEVDSLQALKVSESDSKRGNRFRVSMLAHLGDVYVLEGKYEEAEHTYSEGVTIATNAQDLTREDVASLIPTGKAQKH